MNKPEARIAVRRNRLKTYNPSKNTRFFGGVHYLQNKQEYEIELFNPSTVDVLVKVTIENKSISNKGEGIVLRPGERIFLERFLKNNRKFMFDSYEVGDSNSVKKAIEHNGEIKIEFFNESFFNNNWYLGGTTTGTITYDSSSTKQFFGAGITTTGFDITGSLGTMDSLTNSSDTSTFSRGIVDDSTTISNTFYSSSVPISNEIKVETSKSKINKKALKKNVTGKTTEGSVSDQNFDTIYGKSWESFPAMSYSFKLLPVETKPIYKEDVHRVHCTGCGTKIKKGWHYCASCGCKC